MAQNDIVKVISGFKQYPETVRQMLVEGLSHAFAPDRHDYQVRFAELVRTALRDVQQSQAELRVAGDAAMQAAEAELERVKAACEIAVQAEEAANTSMEAKTALLRGAERKVTEGERGYEAAQVSERRQVKKHKTAETKKAEIDAMIEGPVRMLVDGGWEDADMAKDSVKTVQKYLEKQLGAEAALLAALPGSLSRRPAERTAFDQMAVDTAGAMLKEKAAAFGETVAVEAPGAKQAEAESLGAWAIVEVEKDRVEAAAAELAQATDAHRESARAAKEAHQTVLRHQKAVNQQLAQKKVFDEKDADVAKAFEALGQLSAPPAEACTTAAAGEPVAMDTTE